MARPIIWFGVFLALLGVISYGSTSGRSLTALIPVALGLPMVLLGMAARHNPRSSALHIAAALGALGLLGTLGGLSGLMSAVLLGGKIIPPTSMMLQAVMAVGCAIFLGVYLRTMLKTRTAAR